MGTTLPRSSSGLATVSTALVHALGLTRIRAIALALDGEPIGIPREAFFDAFANCVRSGEMVLSALGYRMVIDRGGVSPKLPRRLWVLFREMSIDPDAYHAVIRSLPREIPLTAVQPLRVRKAFNTMAAFRAPSYADPSRISLQSLATSVNRIIAAEPRPFGRVVVRHLSAVFPVVIAALEGLKASHLPLRCDLRPGSAPSRTGPPCNPLPPARPALPGDRSGRRDHHPAPVGRNLPDPGFPSRGPARWTSSGREIPGYDRLSSSGDRAAVEDIAQRPSRRG